MKKQIISYSIWAAAFFLVPFSLVVGTASSSLAAEPAVFIDKKGIAIRGYDPVAYFEEKKPVKGKAEFSHKYQGATWLFSSSAYRDKFAANPGKYSPRYGGFCAYAMAQGKKVPIDPSSFAVVKGKLYLNFNKSIAKKWSADRDAYISKADKQWKRVAKGS